MIKELQIRCLPQDAAGEQALTALIERETGLSPINAVRILKRSLDARQRTIYLNLSLRIFINEEPNDAPIPAPPYPDVSSAPPVTIIGAGPAGLFAALRLIELGLRPIILERGKNIRDRKKDIAMISRQHTLNPESNYCFGEGGAGAYSDGKLYTRSKKRGPIDKILHTLCRHGAPHSILYDAHPHIGTDKLPRIIENIRLQITNSGGRIHFNTRADSFIIHNRELQAVTAQNNTYPAPVILATGHSARDIYHTLLQQNIIIEPKALAVGVRLEHPQEVIDRLRYHLKDAPRPNYLPPADYTYTTQASNRGVYSFCMCPGGFVIPAATSASQSVVNGMSPSKRNSPWANAGIVVEITPHDLDPNPTPLTLMNFQIQLEEQARIHGGPGMSAPAQRMADFLNNKTSHTLPPSSYTPGLQSSPLHKWLPGIIKTTLQEGLQAFERTTKGFITNEAQLIGVETRTSAPIRIPRDKDHYHHITLKGLFPCGEGAGYAGGIISAAIDGQRCAEAIAAMILR